MNTFVSYCFGRGLACAGLLLSLLAVPAPAAWAAAEITSLAWEDGPAGPALRVMITGSPGYETQSLEGGLRLRVSFPGTLLGNEVRELEGRGAIKGAYPYLTDDGRAANIDLMMTESAELKVEKIDGGFRVMTSSGRPGTGTGADARNSIESVTYAKLPGDRVQIRLNMARPPADPAVFVINNPPRIALDFAATRVTAASPTVRINQGAVATVNMVESDNRSRVVVNLVRPAPYASIVDGKGITITVENPAGGAVGTEAPKTTRFASSGPGGKHGLKSIDFRRGARGDAKVIVDLSDSAVGINIREQAGEIVIDFLDTSVPAELQRRLDVVDFATPVKTIDTYVQGRNTRMVLSASGRYEHLAYQAGKVFTVNIKPIVEKAGEIKKDEFGYSGEKLSLNFQNIETRAALQVIADFTGLNFVTSDSVKGSLTLRLKDVPWDQALDIILDAKNLAMRRKGNVVSVAPADEVAAKEKANLEATKSVLELEPLVSELVQINYAKATEIAALLKSIKAVPGAAATQGNPALQTGAEQTGASTESNTLLSPRGQVTVDQRTNSLLIQDTPNKIREVRKLISQLDQPVRQVMIETRLVEATDDFSKAFGVKWGARAQTVSGANLYQISPDLSGGDLNVNLAANISGPATVAATILNLPNNNVLNLELQALEAESRGKVISSPRLITANQKKARIEQGQERVFTTTTLGVGSTVTKKAVLALEVTPQITPDDRVILDVNVTKDSFAGADTGLINKKEINTQVLLDNGETVVIGGIYEQQQATSVTKVPFFADLPLIGFMFRKNSRFDNKIETLIFLTPRIMSDTLSLK